MPQKITYNIAVKKFIDQGREDILLCQEEYNKWTSKAKFWDLVIEDYFWAIPKMVYKRKSAHPKRAVEKRKKTNLARYGVENPQQVNSIKEKTKKTNIEKYGNACSLHGDTEVAQKIKKKTKETNLKRYGQEHFIQSKTFIEKSKNTCLKQWGVEYFTQTEKSQEKIIRAVKEKWGVSNASQAALIKNKKTNRCIKNWGVDNPLKSKKIREKIRKSNIEKWGVDHWSKTDTYKEQYKNTCKDKFGYNNPAFLNKKRIVESGQWLEEWLEGQKEPKPAYITMSMNFIGKVFVSLEAAKNFVLSYRDNINNLEKVVEKLFEISHFNKKPNELSTVYRPDFKLSQKIYLNTDGLYWHSEHQKDKWYHFNLRKEFEENGLRIFQFREDEIRDKPKIIKSIVNNSLGKTKNKIFARKCTIQKISHNKAEDFLNKNHLMGSTKAKHIGLYDKDQLIVILSWRCKGVTCKIERFCSKIDYSVIGGFTKLLNYLEKNCIDKQIVEIHNWVDLRYGTGSHLSNKDFKLEKETLGWKWTDGKNTFNRLRCRANMDERGLSQQEYMNELKWFKIYDAGQRLWNKSLK